MVVEDPVLAAVITGCAQRERHAKNVSSPGHSCCVGRLAGIFSRQSPTLVASGRRHFASDVIHDAALQSDSLSIRKLEAMLHSDLRNPSPKIAGIRERRNRKRSKRSRRERRDESVVLSRYD